MNGLGSVLTVSGATKNAILGTKVTETIIGTDKNDAIRGGGGGDTLKGGLGDDTYFVYGADDNVVEKAGEGIDTVRSTALHYNLGANVENLLLEGNARFGLGNDLDNFISAGAGSQTLNGGKGNDILTGGADADIFVVAKGNGSDTVNDFQVGVDRIQLSQYGLTSFDQVKSAMTQKGADVVIKLSDTESLTLRDHTTSDFTAKDFQVGLDLSHMHMTFADEFNGLSLYNSKTGTGTWRTEFGYGGEGSLASRNGNAALYMDAKYGLDPFKIHDGVMDIIAAPVTTDLKGNLYDKAYTSGILTTKYSFAQQYGYFEIKAKVPAGEGFFPAFWLLPADGTWPSEIDIFENLGKDPSTLYLTSHTKETGKNTQQQNVVDVQGASDSFHTYGLLWDADYLVWYIDGTEVARVPTSDDMHKPMYMIIDLAVGGAWAGNPTAATGTGALSVDYVHAYQLNDAPAQTPVPTPPPAETPAPEPVPTPIFVDASTVKAWSDYNMGAGIKVLTLMGTDDVNGVGNLLDNKIFGNAGSNRLEGGDGNDTLDGAGGANDVLIGGAGDDIYVVRTGKETLQEAASQGIDVVQSAVSWTLGANFENLTLTGTGAINGFGNDLDNSLIGNASVNRLEGGAGNDVLDGRGGGDTLVGGLGNDTYVVRDAKDVLIEQANQGTDGVQSAISWTLGANFENLALTGTASIDGTGNALDNRIMGTSGDNRIDGGAGNDAMIGGAGNDTYVVDSVRDTVTEKVGEGIDTVQSTVSWTLGANVEKLVLAGTSAIDGTGNADANTLIGNSAANRLDGGAGDDRIDGGAGADQLWGGAGNDTFVYTSTHFGSDVIKDFGTGFDVLEFSKASYGDYASVMSHTQQVGADVVITLASDAVIVLQNTKLAMMTADHFTFI
jgi:Ca2+-binding RTX toxin-like protein